MWSRVPDGRRSGIMDVSQGIFTGQGRVVYRQGVEIHDCSSVNAGFGLEAQGISCIVGLRGISVKTTAVCQFLQSELTRMNVLNVPVARNWVHYNISRSPESHSW